MSYNRSVASVRTAVVSAMVRAAVMRTIRYVQRIVGNMPGAIEMMMGQRVKMVVQQAVQVIMPYRILVVPVQRIKMQGIKVN